MSVQTKHFHQVLKELAEWRSPSVPLHTPAETKTQTAQHGTIIYPKQDGMAWNKETVRKKGRGFVSLSHPRGSIPSKEEK